MVQNKIIQRKNNKQADYLLLHSCLPFPFMFIKRQFYTSLYSTFTDPENSPLNATFHLNHALCKQVSLHFVSMSYKNEYDFFQTLILQSWRCQFHSQSLVCT